MKARATSSVVHGATRLVPLAFLLLAGCQQQNPAAVARHFVDAWAVRADRIEAAGLSTGAARARVDSGDDPLGLGSAAERHRAGVRFHEVSRSTDGDRMQVEYRVTVQQEGANGVDVGELRLTLNRVAGGWRVAELDARRLADANKAPPAPGGGS